MKNVFCRLFIDRRLPIQTQFYNDCSMQRRTKGRVNPLHAFWLVVRLNFRYYLRRDHRMDAIVPIPPAVPFPAESESGAAPPPEPAELTQSLLSFDVISFDIFDTLLFRPFAAPTDLFALLESMLHCPGFAACRIASEKAARARRLKAARTAEVTLQDIYTVLREQMPECADVCMQEELRLETALCFPNPYMQAVVRMLQQHSKQILFVSDMYLSPDCISAMLQRCGYTTADAQLFVSCTYAASKHRGTLFPIVKAKIGAQLRYAHLGDNPHADGEMAKKNGFVPFLYQNINTAGLPYRAGCMQPLLRAVYAGLVNATLHCGAAHYTALYEYGFVYAGILFLGICQALPENACLTGAAEQLAPIQARCTGTLPETTTAVPTAAEPAVPLFPDTCLRNIATVQRQAQRTYLVCPAAADCALSLLAAWSNQPQPAVYTSKALQEIRAGILAFADTYVTRLQLISAHLRIDAQDACAPLQMAAADATYAARILLLAAEK